VVQKAVELVLPAIEGMFERGIAKRKDLHIVVMDPTKDRGQGNFEDSILFEHSFGDPERWESDYAAIARSKALQTWRSGLPSIMTHWMAPATLRPGDTRHWGSFEYLGVIVSASGIQPWFDMMISAWIAIAIQQVSQNELQEWLVQNPNRAFFPV